MWRAQRNSFRTKPRLGATLDRTHSLSRGLRAFWLLNEGMGDTPRDLVNGQAATFTNSPTWTGGRFGAHAVQTGGTSYLDVGNPSAVDFTTGTGFTCSFAARCNTVPNFADGMIASKGSEWFVAFNGPSTGLRFVLAGGGGAGGVVAESRSMAVGEYSIWSVTYNRTSKAGNIYRDGALVATATLSPFGDFPSSTNNLSLGSAAGSSPWTGTIDWISFHDRDLGAGEILLLHAQPFIHLIRGDSLFSFLGESSAAGTTVSATASYAYTAAAVINSVPPNTNVSAAASYGYTAAAVVSSVPPNANVSAAASYGYTAAAVVDSTVPSGSVAAAASYGYTAAAVLATAPPSGSVSASASYGYTAAAVLSTAAPAASVSASATYGYGAAAVINTVAPSNGTVAVTASYGYTAAAVVVSTTTVVDFSGAIQNAFNGDSNLADLAGLWLDQAPAKEATTVATVSFAGGAELQRSDTTRISERICRFRVYSLDADTATVQGQTLADRVKAWGNLFWSGGYSIAFYERSRSDGAKIVAQPVGAKPRYYFEVSMIARVVEDL